jgi:hypothetical protein
MANNRWDSSHPERAGWAIVDLPQYLRETQARPQPFETREQLQKAREIANELRVRPSGDRGLDRAQ